MGEARGSQGGGAAHRGCHSAEGELAVALFATRSRIKLDANDGKSDEREDWYDSLTELRMKVSPLFC